MKVPDTVIYDLDRIAHGEAPALTDDAEHIALLVTAQRLADGMRSLREAPPGVQEGLEARLVAQVPIAARQRRLPMTHQRPLRRWQAVIGIATAAALILAIIGGAIVWGSSSQPVSAQVLLDRAQDAAQDAAPSGITSYHMTATRQVPTKGNATINQEIWYAGTDRQRTDEQIKDTTGATLSMVTIFSGTETWLVRTENGQTSVVHTTGAQWGKPASDPSQGGSVADLIAQYNQKEKGCQDVRQQGETTVIGRAAYVLVVTPNKAACDMRGQDQGTGAKPTPNATQRAEATDVAGLKATAAAKDTGGQNQKAVLDTSVTQMVVTVDKQTSLPLKIEYHNPSGAVIDNYAVTSLELNVPIPAATFAYTPPAGVTVKNFTDLPAQDVKATIGAGMQGGTPPAKKP